MSRDFEDVLKLAADSDGLVMNDKLARIIKSTDRELTLDELDMVTAASKPDYEKFKARLERKDKCV